MSGQAFGYRSLGHVEPGAGTDRDDDPAAERLVAGGCEADFIGGGNVHDEAAFPQRAGGNRFSGPINSGFGLGNVGA